MVWEPFDAGQIGTVIEHCREWQLGGGRNTGPGQAVDMLNSWREDSGRSFRLKHRDQKGQMGWMAQTRGVNLDIFDDARADTARKMARWFFHREIGSRKAVRYGELVAMGYGTSPSFYKYAVTAIGINLVNTGTPFMSGGSLGPSGRLA